MISDANTKQKIKELAEKEEKLFYQVRRPKQWLKDLQSIGTDEKKDFLVQADYLIAIFSKHYDEQNGIKTANYYVKESVGIATGFLISALHLFGLSVLTYTPSNMRFLSKLFSRPENERPFMLLAVGLPHRNATVPNISKKMLKEILNIHVTNSPELMNSKQT